MPLVLLEYCWGGRRSATFDHFTRGYRRLCQFLQNRLAAFHVRLAAQFSKRVDVTVSGNLNDQVLVPHWAPHPCLKRRGVIANRSAVKILACAFSACVLVSTSTIAQSVAPLDKIQNQEELNQAITALDAALFDAYNKCDLAKFASFIDEKVEFYHDQGDSHWAAKP